MKKAFLGFVFVILSALLLGNSQLSPLHLGGCEITSFTMNPSDPYVFGDHVILSGTSTCGTVKFNISGEGFNVDKAETGQPNQTETWKTEEFSSGNFDVCFLARGDGGWDNANRSCRHVYVEGGQAPPPGSEPGDAVACWINTFKVTPSSVPKGETVHLAGQGQCDGNARATKFTINGVSYDEYGGYQNDFDYRTTSTGTFTACMLLTAGDWEEDAAKSCAAFTVTATGTDPGTDISDGGTADNGVPGQTNESGPDGSYTPNTSGSGACDYSSSWPRNTIGGWNEPGETGTWAMVLSDASRLVMRSGPHCSYPGFGYGNPQEWYFVKDQPTDHPDWVKVATSDYRIAWLNKAYVRIEQISGRGEPSSSLDSTSSTSSSNSSYLSNLIVNNLLREWASEETVLYCSDIPGNSDKGVFQQISEWIVPKVQAYEPWDSDQCTALVDEERTDLDDWHERGHAYRFAESACEPTAQNMGITASIGDVRYARPGDIVVWSKGCGVLPDDDTTGHVAIVQAVYLDSNQIRVLERNYDFNGSQREYTYTVSSCMTFVHKPNDKSTCDNSRCTGQTCVISDDVTVSVKNPFWCGFIPWVTPDRCIEQ